MSFLFSFTVCCGWGLQMHGLLRQTSALSHFGNLFLAAEEGGWLKKACEKHRVLLLDQRGTGLSSPITAAALSSIGSPSKQAEFLTHFRQDNIVRDCESIRNALKIIQWTVLGQSFGGFCALSYLSLAPKGIKTALITGGLAPISQSCTADAVYMALYRRVILQVCHSSRVLSTSLSTIQRGHLQPEVQRGQSRFFAPY